MTKSIWNKSFFAALGLAAVAVTAWHGSALAESMSQKIKDKYKNDPTVIVGNVDALDHRRTLFAPFGQKTLMLEVPQGMCFLDESNYTERQIMNRIRDLMHEKTKHTLVAIFTDCLALSSALNQPTHSATTLADAGLVTWPVTPGEKVPPTLAEYMADENNLDKLNIDDMLIDFLELQVDEQPRTTEGGITRGYTGKVESADQTINLVGAAGITMMKGMPVVFTMSHSGKKLEKSKESLQDLLDKMLLQQVALNNLR